MGKANWSRLSIVFPNLNGDKVELKTLLTSVKNSSYPQKNLGVIMVDNGSTNDSPAFVAKNFPMVKIIKLDKNYGFSKAVNIGIERSKGEYIFITNNDVRLHKDCLKLLVEYLHKNTKTGIVGPKIYDLKNPTKILCTGCKYNFFTGRFSLLKKANKIQEADWVSGCAMAVSRSLWESLGGFDEGFFFSGEEVDFALRAKKLGFKIIYFPKASVWHFGGATINNPIFSSFKDYHILRSKLRLILKHSNILQVLTGFIWQIFVSAPVNIYYKKPKNISYIYEAIIWNLKNLPQNYSIR